MIKLRFESKTTLRLRLEKLRESAMGQIRKNCIESNEVGSKNGLEGHILKGSFQRKFSKFNIAISNKI